MKTFIQDSGPRNSLVQAGYVGTKRTFRVMFDGGWAYFDKRRDAVAAIESGVYADDARARRAAKAAA